MTVYDSMVKLARMNGRILLNEKDNSLLYHINNNGDQTYSIFTTSKQDSTPHFEDVFHNMTAENVIEFVNVLTA